MDALSRLTVALPNPSIAMLKLARFGAKSTVIPSPLAFDLGGIERTR
jgi:hypothetical protein